MSETVAMRGATALDSGDTDEEQVGQPSSKRKLGVLIGGVLLGLVLGAVLGNMYGSSAIPGLENRLGRLEEGLATANSQNAQLEDKTDQLQADKDELNQQASGLQSRIVSLQKKVIPAEKLREGKAALLEREQGLDDRAAQLGQREGGLDAREGELEAREAAVGAEEQAIEDATFGNGTFVVGEDIPAGTYTAPGGGSCYWARLSGLSGTLGDIMANHIGPGTQTVSLSGAEAAFETQGCGEWSPR
ncbi:MAG: hypothetical protein H0V60_01105 [Actinobacteria bacterium]|nr:hypothetical protein [Actinomycetota bacterium]